MNGEIKTLKTYARFGFFVMYSGSYHVTSGITEVLKTLCLSRQGQKEETETEELWKTWVRWRPTSDVTHTVRDL